MEKFIAVGDVHGCIDQLEEILNMAEAYPSHRMVFLGDYVDRGPDSNAVIECLMGLDAVLLKGNHEEMLFNALDACRTSFDLLTLQKESGIRMRNIRQLRKRLRDVLVSDDYIFTHAGMDPARPPEDQDAPAYLWTRHDGGYPLAGNKIVVHGHTRVGEVEAFQNRININTGCGFGGPLTALVLPERKTLTSSRSPAQRTKSYDVGRWLTELDDLVEEL
jgi:serine/threonine protein phosphatase 1